MIYRSCQLCHEIAVCGAETDWTAWTYDAVGNRLSEATPAGTTTYTYDPATGRLDSCSPPGGSPVAYTYDAVGNVTQAGADTFTWDPAGRMRAATVAGTTESYTYDETGRRTATTAGGATSTTVWDPISYEPALTRDDAGATIATYLPAGLGVDQADGRQYFHRDALGSIQATTDAAGAPAWTYDYTAYGIPNATFAGAGAPLTDSPLGFTGQQEDNTGLVHLRARQYDPATGRFLSPDPAGYGYAYAHANPLVFIDPHGLFGWSSVRGPLRTINTIAGWTAAGAGVAAMAIAATGIGLPIGAAVGTIAAASGAIAAATGVALAIDSCANHKGSCASAIVFAAADIGLAGSTRLIRTPAVTDAIASRFGNVAPQATRNFGSHGSEFLDDAIRSPVVRPDLANLSSKIQRQMGPRGWTPDLIDEAVLQGRGTPRSTSLAVPTRRRLATSTRARVSPSSSTTRRARSSRSAVRDSGTDGSGPSPDRPPVGAAGGR